MRRLLLVLPALLASAASGRDYEISNYVASFQLNQKSADADVTLDIAYRVISGGKSDGFKYVGQNEPSAVHGTDDRGAKIPVSVRREYEVKWPFSPVGPGEKRVIIRFRLPNVLSGSRSEGNRLSADWAGAFKVPVRRGVYEIVFPPGVSPETRESNFVRSRTGNQDILTWEQKPLRDKALSIQFAPGIADRVLAASESRTQPEAFFVAALALGFLRFIAWQRQGSQRGGSDLGGVGGCGGGGCGGGGCGGGCGG